MGRRVCFFAKVASLEILERHEFYSADIRILRELGFEVVVCNDPLRIPSADLYFVWWWTWAFAPLARARLAGAPVVVVGVFDHIGKDGEFQDFPRRPALHRWLIRQALKRADANVFCTRRELELATKRFTVRNPSFSYLEIDGALYEPGSGARENFLLSICWMGKGNVWRKCMAELIDGFRLVSEARPDMTLVIAGQELDGAALLRERVAKHGLGSRVRFAGTIDRAEKIRLMQTCAAYVQPTRTEGFGVALLEAMACGAPVVTSPTGVVPEVVGSAAVFVDGEDPEDIARGVEAVLADERLRADLARSGRERVVGAFPPGPRKEGIAKVLRGVCDWWPVPEPAGSSRERVACDL